MLSCRGGWGWGDWGRVVGVVEEDWGRGVMVVVVVVVGDVSYKFLAIAWFFLLIKSSYVLRVVKLLTKWWPKARSTTVRTMSYAWFASKQEPVRFACVCVYQCVHMSRCVNPELVRVITCDPFKPGSPNMDQRCKTIWSRSLYSFRRLALTFKVNFNSKDKISLYPVSPPE